MSEFVARREDAGERLDAYVARKAELSRAQAAKLIDAGNVTIDGSHVSKSHRIEEGQRVWVEFQQPSPPPEAEPIDLHIVYEDDSLLVVSKPAGLVVHPAP